MRLLARFWRNEDGATLIEYAVVSAMISIGLIGIFVGIGTKVQNMFVPVGNGLS